MAEREEKADADGALALLHQLARDVVDRGDVVGVDSMPEAKSIGEQGRAEQHGLVAQGRKRPEPGRDIRRDQEPVHADQATAQIGIAVGEEFGNHFKHNTLACE